VRYIEHVTEHCHYHLYPAYKILSMSTNLDNCDENFMPLKEFGKQILTKYENLFKVTHLTQSLLYFVERTRQLIMLEHNCHSSHVFKSVDGQMRLMSHSSLNYNIVNMRHALRVCVVIHYNEINISLNNRTFNRNRARASHTSLTIETCRCATTHM
jgi:hypothetical protein